MVSSRGFRAGMTSADMLISASCNSFCFSSAVLLSNCSYQGFFAAYPYSARESMGRKTEKEWSSARGGEVKQDGPTGGARREVLEGVEERFDDTVVVLCRLFLPLNQVRAHTSSSQEW